MPLAELDIPNGFEAIASPTTFFDTLLVNFLLISRTSVRRNNTRVLCVFYSSPHPPITLTVIGCGLSWTNLCFASPFFGRLFSKRLPSLQCLIFPSRLKYFVCLTPFSLQFSPAGCNLISRVTPPFRYSTRASPFPALVFFP